MLHNVPLVTSNHVCQLPPETDGSVRYIESGLFVEIRRKFRNWTLADPKLPHCRKYLKSSTIIKHDQEVHMKRHYYMIHPFSKCRVYWECFQIVVHVMVFTIGPIEFGTLTELIWEIKMVKIGLDALYFLDMIASFFTGYYDYGSNRVVLSWKEVSKHHMRGTFFTDIISMLNVDLVVFWINPASELAWTYKYFNFFKLFKLPAFARYMNTFRDWKGFSKNKFNILRCTVSIFFLYLWYSSAYMLALVHSEDEWLVQASMEGRQPLVSAITKIFHFLFLFGFANKYQRTWLAFHMEILTLTLGMILRVYVLSRFLQIFLKTKTSQSKYDQIIEEVKQYTRYKNISATLRNRILDYYEFCFQKTYFNENQIMDTISNQLKQAILMQTCETFLQTVGILRDLPTTLLYRIVMSLQVEYYLPKDLIVQEGDIGDGMYFIFTGTVAVYTKEGKEVCHLYDGSNFGEICLVLKTEPRRVANVVAIDYCECYMLKRDAFLAAIEPYPDVYERLADIAKKRLQSTEDYSKIA